MGATASAGGASWAKEVAPAEKYNADGNDRTRQGDRQTLPSAEDGGEPTMPPSVEGGSWI